jgi:hypothetical protein
VKSRVNCWNNDKKDEEEQEEYVKMEHPAKQMHKMEHDLDIHRFQVKK